MDENELDGMEGVGMGMGAASMGMNPDDGDGADEVVIEIENPEAAEMSVDGLEIDLMPEKPEPKGIRQFDANLAEFMDDDELSALADELMEEVDGDRASRKSWVDTYVEGLDTLGLEMEERTEPWDGACGLVHPMLIEAAVRFQSETIVETFPAKGPVKTKIIGKETEEKIATAHRVEEDMNYRLTEEMPEYRGEHERMLLNMALCGAGFKKVYFDPNKGRACSMYVQAEDGLVPFGISSVRDAHRFTHVMRKTQNEVKKLQKSGFYVDVDLPDPVLELDEISEKKAEKAGVDATSDDRHTLYEIHTELVLEDDPLKDDDEIAIPYVVTIDRTSNIVLGIRRNWEEGDELYRALQYFVGYNYVTGFGAYGLGLVHLVGALAKGSTSILRQLIDAGTLSNLPGGLKSRGLRIKGDDSPIRPGEFRDVDVPSGSVRDNIMPLPYKEPSQVLFALFGAVVEEGRRIAATADLKISDQSAQAPVGTTLALLERQLKVMSAVQARVHSSMKEELKLLKKIIQDHADDTYDYQPDSGSRMLLASDYAKVDVIPVSDPNASTLSQRIAQLQAVIQLSQGAPQVYDLAQLHRKAIESIGWTNAEKLVPLPDDKVKYPRDPISENMGALTGKPMKAMSYQDHDAHIAAHQSMLQDPTMAAVFQSPTGQGVPPALMAHIQEHIAFKYKQQIEAMMGSPLPEDKEEGAITPEVEKMLSQRAAQAAQQLSQQNQMQAQQQAAQQKMQDPVLQQQMKEIELKEQEILRKARNDDYDYQVALERVALERERLEREDFRANRKMDVDNEKASTELRERVAENRTRSQLEAAKLLAQSQRDTAAMGQGSTTPRKEE